MPDGLTQEILTQSVQLSSPSVSPSLQGKELTAALVADFGGHFTSELVRAFGTTLTAKIVLCMGAAFTGDLVCHVSHNSMGICRQPKWSKGSMSNAMSCCSKKILISKCGGLPLP